MASMTTYNHQFVDDIIPRSTSPECLDNVDNIECPPFKRREGSNDTASSSASSIIATPTTSTTTANNTILKPKAKKSLSSVFSKFGSLKMTSTTSIEEPMRSPSVHSSSSASSTASKISKSFSRIMKKQPVDMTCGSLGVVPLLTDKYGDYIKSNSTSKGMGSTSKKNIASGATAVIRLVKQKADGRILAVKEFKKREKSEIEHEYENRLLNEYQLSKSASTCPYIVDTLDLVKDEKGRWCVVMEYVSLSISIRLLSCN